MKILVFGGSFDPPHVGHRSLLVSALRKLRPDLAYIVPARLSPFKEAHHASASDRLRMAELFRAGIHSRLRRRVRLDSAELRRRGPSYTFQTLRSLRRRHPGAEIYFLTGSDAFATLAKWKKASELRKTCGWVVGMRPDGSLPSGLPSFITLPGLFPRISSTDVRARLIAGVDIAALVPRRVHDYIRRRRLYALDIHEELRSTLKPTRYEHTLEVARLAAQLAKTHGFDVESAALAGLLHDAGRRFDPAEMTRYASKRRLRIPARAQIVLHEPMLQHAFISEDLAKTRFRIHDSRVLSAIRNHTLGAVGMPALDRLLFVADSASADRTFPEAAKIRALAARDLEAGFRKAVRTKWKYTRRDRAWMHPATRRFVRWALNR